MRLPALLLLLNSPAVAQTIFLSDYLNSPFPVTLVPGSLASASANVFPGTPVSPSVSIRPVGSLTVIAAPVLSSVQGSVTFFVPPEVPPGPAQLTVGSANAASQWQSALVVASGFVLYRRSNSGPPQAQQFEANGTVSLNGLASPAKPGEAVVLWGTGLGGTSSSAVTVTLGGVTQKIQFAGHSPTLRGVDQINFQVAQATPTGCYVPLVVGYGQSSTAAYLSISADGSPCVHSWGLSAADLQLLDAGGRIDTATLAVTSDFTVASADHASRRESASVPFSFGLGTAEIASRVTSPGPVRGCFALPNASLPNQLVGGILASSSNVFSGVSSMTLAMTPANGSAAFTLSSDNSTLPTFAFSPPAVLDSTLNAIPPSVFPAGQWTWTVPAAKPFPGFSDSFALPAPLQLVTPPVLSRDRDQIISWNGATYGPRAALSLTLSGTAPFLSCTAPASDGSITIPKNLLAQLPASSASISASVTDAASPPVASVRQASGTTLLLFVNAASSDFRPVDIQ